MSLIIEYTIRCDPGKGKECPEKAGPDPSLQDVRDAAWKAGWHLGSTPFGAHDDQCPRHLRPLDRVN